MLNIGTKAGRGDKRGEAAAAPPPAVVKPRPRSLTGRTYRVETPLGTAYTVVNEHGDGEPFEVFVSVGKAGSDTMAVAEAMGRSISLALRHALARCRPSVASRRSSRSSRGSAAAGRSGSARSGCSRSPTASRAFWPSTSARRRRRRPNTPAAPAAKLVAGDICPECGQATFVYEEGCKKCYGCGFNEC